VHILKAAAAEEGFAMTGETGSYRYMAPEVFRHERLALPQATDIYSLACILF
jgi:serine/threonine protein kinase